MNVKYVTAKLGKMRKEQQFLVQITNKNNFVVQSDKAIGMFDMNTGKGKLNTKGHYYPDLMFAEPFDFPPEFVKACHQAYALTGDLIGASPVTGPIYYAGITEISVPRPMRPILSDTDWCAALPW